jgi:hypothetical protein
MRTSRRENNRCSLEERALPTDPTPTHTRPAAAGGRCQAALVLLLLLGLAATLSGCGAAGAAPTTSPAPPPPPPPSGSVTVTVSPSSASLFLGQSENFTAQVTGASDTSVNWAVSGIAGGNSAVGTISPAGVYTAPQVLPSSASVTITATSVASPSSSGSATVTIASDIAIVVSPASATVAIGSSQLFTATISASGNPSTSVTWALTGTQCASGACGSFSVTGDTANYTSPSTLPSSSTATLTATSVADPSKSAAATITIAPACSPAVSVSPSAASVGLTNQQTFTATVCVSLDQTVTWTIVGTGCGSGSCGSIAPTSATTAVYTAPSSLPPVNPIALAATSQADPAASASATITITSNLAVEVSPTFAEVAASRRQSLAATVSGTSNEAVTWAVDGIANGNASVGEICQAGSNPCAPPAGPAAGPVDYLAPAAVPSGNPVLVTATSAADSSLSATAEMDVIAHLIVSVAPAAAFIAPTGDAEFTAIVVGTSNQAVTWSVSCAAGSCGSVSSTGVFTAPSQAPSPNAITVTATSQDDPSQSAEATVALSTAATVESLAPSSVIAGEADSFTLLLTGLNFVPSSPGPGSALLVNGAARATICASSLACTATIDPSDVAAAGNVTLQIENPDGTFSNPVSLVAAAEGSGAATVTLSASVPIAGGEEIAVVEPTTAGSGVPPLDVAFAGLVDSTGSSCDVQAGSLALARPSSGTVTFTLCLWGNQMIPGDNFAFTAPGPGDLVLGAPQSFAGSLVALPVTLSASTLPGPRTLFVTDPDFNQATATAAIEVR